MPHLYAGLFKLLDRLPTRDDPFSHLPPRQADIARLLAAHGPLRRRQIAALLGWDESNVGHHLERMHWMLRHQPYGSYELRRPLQTRVG